MSSLSAKRLLDLIKTRRTVRSFQPHEPVGRESLERILEAGSWAPYAPYHPQGWRFIALQSEQRDAAVHIVTRCKMILKYIRAEYESAAWQGEAESDAEHFWKERAMEFAKNLGRAPVLIVGLVPSSDSISVRGHDLGSAWTAVQNMMLQAHAEGLSSGVVTLHSPKVEHELIEFLGLPADEWILAFLLNVGHPAEAPTARPRREGVSEIRE